MPPVSPIVLDAVADYLRARGYTVLAPMDATTTVAEQASLFS